MMKKYLAIVALAVIPLACAHQTTENALPDKTPIVFDGHNSRNSLDWAGTYKGVLPCADCDGIETQITLNQDHSYELKTRYLGKADDVFTKHGRFEWDEAGGKITIEVENEMPSARQYRVGENVLFKLDIDGNRITGALAEHYQLKKQ